MKSSGFVVAGLALAASVIGVQALVKKPIVYAGAKSGEDAVVMNGKTYVPVSILKKAGFTVTDEKSQLSVTPPAGGANQMAANEGKVGDWLFNGVWRFRVNSFSADADTKRITINVDLRNGTKTDGIALSGTGFEALNLVFNDGSQMQPGNITEIRDVSFVQGNGVNLNLVWELYDDFPNKKPTKLMLVIRPDEFTTKYMKTSMKIAYTSADPSFRVAIPMP
ncbi:MAG: hypothetical protein JST35_02830 [Armatimonadetes bacterium]|nr:hypothetical protein [Armatimonadota bacterium]